NYRMGLIAASLLVSSQVNAESVLCDATQASTNQLPQLEQSCPIGKGVWGSKAPKRHSDNELFWVQCGLLNKPLSLNRAKPLYEKISTNVWMKPEGGDYRCLIGPYSTFSDARKDLTQVRKVPGYGEAFIRMVDKSKTSSQPI
ncbi:SPOR domain-containing protein, partial [Vibrio breoganii]